MKLAVITIGDEILSGFTLNTNAAWIGQQLLKIGVEINTQLSISDKKEEIIKYLNYLTSEKYSHIIVTGGLGPTHDDVTPSAFYKFFGAKPIFDEKYWKELKTRFAKRNIKIPKKNKNQAVRPNNGNVINNPVGSARGLHFVRDATNYFAMPGVPTEMKAMMESSIIPLIKDDSDIDIYVKTIKTIGMGESAVAEKIEHLIDKYSGKIKIAFLPQLSRVDIRLFSIDKKLLDLFVCEIEEILAEIIYGYDEDNIEYTVAKLLINNNVTIATAESCTGGLLAHRLTNVSGSSEYMLGGVVSYSNEVKIAKVGVKEDTLIAHGAVSEQTAGEMAVGIQKKFQSDIGIGITGIAGPTGGTDEKPVGLVYIGLAVKDKLIVKRFLFLKNRKANKIIKQSNGFKYVKVAIAKMSERLLRTFISVTLPKKIVSTSKMLQTIVLSKKDNINWVNPGNIHLTLKFMGQTPLEATNEINEVLKKTVVNYSGMEFNISGTGCFPNVERPRVLWLGIDGELSNLQNFVVDLNNKLEKIGFPVDEDEFIPHITLARIKYPLKEIPDILNFINTSYEPIKFNINRIRFMSSELFPNGPIYSILGSHFLGENPK